MAVIPKWLIQYFCQTPRIKAESPHFNRISVASFQIHCGHVRRQKNENCFPVQILMDRTVYLVCFIECDSLIEGLIEICI